MQMGLRARSKDRCHGLRVQTSTQVNLRRLEMKPTVGSHCKTLQEEDGGWGKGRSDLLHPFCNHHCYASQVQQGYFRVPVCC